MNPGEPPLLPRAARTAAAWSAVVLLVVAVVSGLVLLAFVLRAVTAPLAIAVLGTALLHPFNRMLVRRSVPRSWAAGLTCVVLVALVAGTVWVLVRTIGDNAAKIGAALSDAADRLRDRYGGGGDPGAEASDGLRELGDRLGESVASGVVSGVGIAVQVVSGGILVLALTFFLLRDGHKLPGLVRALTPERHRDIADRIVRRSFLAVSGYMRGTTIIALIDATFIAIGLALLGVPGAPGLAALVFVGAYVPYVGAFLSGLLAVLVAFADGGLGTALGALGVVLAVQLIEGTFLQPGIQSRTVALHPAVVMGAVVAGGAVAGILGALLAVPVVAVLVSVLAIVRDARGADGADGAGGADESATPVPGGPGAPGARGLSGPWAVDPPTGPER
ncbi:AI-2E family transporter [Yinghuangia sp. YIM S09857]|uniref:AI-2E family transporter n=1 Tax=Yinghuangia sp. YIM S09857 TaxID=3436929 RepID=UPI003F539A40